MILGSSALRFTRAFFVGAFLLSAQAQEAEVAAPATTQDAPPAWGKLVRTPIFLEASRALVDSLPLPTPQSRWIVPEAELSELKVRLQEAGLPPGMPERLLSPGQSVTSDGWIYLFPTRDELLAMSAESRARLYPWIGRHDRNEYHHYPVLILTDTVEEWYRSSRLRPDLLTLISRLAYRRGQAWAFSDVEALIAACQSEDEARVAYKTCTRTRSYLVRLEIDAASNASGLKAYWSGGLRLHRRKDLEPLVESLQATGEMVRLDLAHVLPPLARKLLYTYPGPEHAAEGILPDCHWTSLNFFNSDPHSYLLDSNLATSRVLQDYEAVPPPYRYGDVIFLLDRDHGNAFHSCIYLAEDLVYTKNGRNNFTPWIISTLEDVSRLYLATTDGYLQAYREKLAP
jgi:hypothetical protein